MQSKIVEKSAFFVLLFLVLIIVNGFLMKSLLTPFLCLLAMVFLLRGVIFAEIEKFGRLFLNIMIISGITLYAMSISITPEHWIWSVQWALYAVFLFITGKHIKDYGPWNKGWVGNLTIFWAIWLLAFAAATPFMFRIPLEVAASAASGDKFQVVKAGAPIDNALDFKPVVLGNISVLSVDFSNKVFVNKTKLPYVMRVGVKPGLDISVAGNRTGYFESGYTIKYKRGDRIQKLSGKMAYGLFADDGSERAYVAAAAVEAYKRCRDKDPDSAATLNNLGIIYRLLGRYDLAEKYIKQAMDKALNDRKGYGGVMMNMGVVFSDQKKGAKAKEYYRLTIDKTITGETKSNFNESALIPQLNFNLALESYNAKKYTEVLSYIEKVLKHQKTSDFLKAKAYVLRGAVYCKQKKNDLARTDFEKGFSLDQKGPIGRLAQNNLAVLK